VIWEKVKRMHLSKSTFFDSEVVGAAEVHGLSESTAARGVCKSVMSSEQFCHRKHNVSV
jgi:hypothetical protein